MRSWIRKIENEFLRNVLVMLSGNGLALVLPFFLAPIITRIYAPADIGSYELFAKIVALAAIISSLRLEIAIVLPTSEKEAAGITKLALIILSTVTVFSVIPSYLFNYRIAESLKNEGIATLLYWLPFAIFLTGIFQVFQYTFIRQKNFRYLSGTRLIASGFNHGGKAGLGFFSASPLSLVLGHISGLFAPILFFFTARGFVTQLNQILKANIKGLLYKYRDFPLVNSSHVLSDELRNFAFLAIISYYYGEMAIGLVGLTIRYLRIPVELLGNSLGSVFLQKISASEADSIEKRAMILNISKTLAVLGLVPFTVLFFFGPEIFNWVFGADWREAGSYAAIVTPWLFLSFIVSPISAVPVVMKKQRPYFFISLGMNGLLLLAMFYIAAAGGGIASFLVAVTIIQSLFLIILLLWFYKITE